MQIEISRRIVQVKRTKLLATLLAALAMLSTSCGTGDKLASISISAVGESGAGIVNLAGLGGTLQLHVNGNYTSGKIINETNWATYTITPEGFLDDESTPLPTPPNGLTINATGMVTATEDTSGNGICTWLNLGTTQQPSWFFTGDYKIVATFRGMPSNPIFIPVASGADPVSGQVGQCGPS
jgi:hypothetical protein